MSPIQENIWQILFSFSALHGFFISLILLFSKSENKLANRILATLVFTISLILTSHVFYFVQILEQYPHLIHGAFPLWFIFGPLFYFYFKSFLNKNTKFRYTDLLHLIPLAICLIIMFPFYSQSADAKLALLLGTGSRNVPSYLFISILYLYTLQTIGYIIITSRMLSKYEKTYKEESANTKVISIEWLRTLIYILIAFLAIDFIIGTSFMITKSNNDNYGYASIITVSLFIYFIAYNLILHPNRVFVKTTANIEDQKEPTKYKNSSLEVPESEEIENRLRNIMSKDKPYLNEELKISDLAKMVQVSSHKLSQVLNQNYQQSFYHFINHHRIQEVQKQLLEENTHQITIQTIALQCGFNSNASFYRVFKQQTGLTPTQFIKSKIQ